MEEAYERPEQLHKERLLKKLDFARQRRKVNQQSEPRTEDEITEEEVIVTDLTKSLNEEELRLLSKGPKFALTSRINEIDITANFCALTNQL